MDNVWYLEEVDLYRILCPHKFKEFEKAHDFNHFKKGEFIYFPEDSANKVYLIAKGKVKIGNYTEEGDEVIKSILQKGDLFGEMAILGEEKRKDYAMAIDRDTIICPLTVEMMHQMMRENHPFSLYVYKLIGFRIRKLERRLDMLLFKDARSRLTDFIQEMAEEMGEERNETILIKHPYTQKDMADLIGISRPTINILLNELSEEGVISFQRKIIKVEKPRELAN